MHTSLFGYNADYLLALSVVSCVSFQMAMVSDCETWLVFM